MPNLKEVRTRTTGGLSNPSGQPYNSRGLPPDPRDQYGGGGGLDRRRLPEPGGRELTRGEAEELINKEYARRVAYSSILPQRENSARTVYSERPTFSMSTETSRVTDLRTKYIHLDNEDYSPGKKAAKNKCSQELLDACDNAILHWGPDDYFYDARGEALSQLSRHAEAVETYEKSLMLKDTNFGARLGKIKSLLALNKFNEIITECDKGIDIVKRHMPDIAHVFVDKYVDYKTEALKGLEKKWFDLGYHATDPKEEIKYYDKVLELNPKKDAAWNNKGWALASLGKYEEAITCYEQALILNPENNRAKNNKGSAMKKLAK